MLRPIRSIRKLSLERLEDRSLLSTVELLTSPAAFATVYAEDLNDPRIAEPPETKSATWDSTGKVSPANPSGEAVQAFSTGFSTVAVQVKKGTGSNPALFIGMGGGFTTSNFFGSFEGGSGASAGGPITLRIIPNESDSAGDRVRVTLTVSAQRYDSAFDQDSFIVGYRNSTGSQEIVSGSFPEQMLTKKAVFDAVIGDEFDVAFFMEGEATLGEDYRHPHAALGITIKVEPLKPKLVLSAATPADDQGRFWITNGGGGAPQMPKITFIIENPPGGAASSLSVKWVTHVYLQYGASPGGKAVDTEQIRKTKTGNTYTLEFPIIAGGDIDVSATFTVNDKTVTINTEEHAETKNLKILGRNPSKAHVQALIDAQPIPAAWPANSSYSYHTVLRQIAYHETAQFGGYRQFRPSSYQGYPLWNLGGDRGHGIMQITPAKTEAIKVERVWDWRANVLAGIELFNRKLVSAQNYAKNTANHPAFLAAVEAFNATRAKPVQVKVPELTPNERVLFAIRYYNGVGGLKDSIGRPFCHEYEPAVYDDGRLKLKVNETTLVGWVEWVRVCWRRRTAGEPNYVKLVLGSPSS